MKIVVTGPRGRLGSALVALGCVALDADIADPLTAQTAVAWGADALINCAAWTDVDGAENPDNREAVVRRNVRGPFVLARNFPATLVHISTGYVFDGKAGPYLEDDEPSPVSFYGMSKLGGEAALAVHKGPTLLIRTLDIFSGGVRSDFVASVREHLAVHGGIALPDDLMGNPIFAPHLAEAILAAVEKGLTGVLNLAGNYTISRYVFGRFIAAHFDFDPDLVQPISYVQAGAPRPVPRGGLRMDKARSLGLPVYAPGEGLVALKQAEQSETP